MDKHFIVWQQKGQRVMGKKFRLTAWILAVSILLNMVPLPASSQENAAATQTNTEEIIQTGDTGSDPTGDTGSDPTGDTGSDPTDDTGSDPTGDTGSDPTGDTGSDPNGGTGDGENGGTGEELIVGDDNELIIGDDNNLGDSGSDQSDDATDEELMIMPLEGESGEWESLDDWKAKCEDINYNETAGLVIDSGWDLICLSNIDSKLYRDKKLVLTNPNLDTTTCPEVADPSLAFQGLGTDAEPFVGIVEYGAGNEATITLNRPLFNRLSFQENTSLCTLYLKSSQNTTALLADTVDGCTNAAIQVFLENPVASEDVSAVLPPVFQTIDVQGEQNTNIQISVTNRAEVGVTGNGLICNTLDTNAQLTVTGIKNYLGLTAESGDAGGLVGTMKDGSILQVGDSAVSGETAGSTAIEISNVSGAATGGLVGTMKGTATVNVNAAVTVSGISGSNAGGLVGSMASNATLNAGSGSLILKDTDDTKAVTGSNSAGGYVGSAEDIFFTAPNLPLNTASATLSGKALGGLIGTYTYTGRESEGVLNVVSGKTITDLRLNNTDNSNGSTGALFGKLINKGTFTISDVSVSKVTLTSGTVGGLIGRYEPNELANTLTIIDATVSTSLTNDARDYGGLIGVDDCGRPAYIKISGNTTVAMNSGGTPTDFGGLVSRLQGNDVGHLLNLEGTVTVNVTGNFKSSASTGGLVAYLPYGVIRIGGNVTIEGTLAPEEKNRYRSGWVVGELGNALVYQDLAVDGSLTLTNKTADTKYNDLGRWGQVLKANDNAALPGVLEFNETNHTVTVAAATNTNGNYQITNLKEFATVALRLQLNPVGALVVDGDITSPGHVDITIGNDITLSNGLFGLQRDHNESKQFDVTIHGNSHTITLPNTTVYPTGESHNRLGLLSNVSALTADGLKVAGGIDFDQSSGSIYAGGLAAYAAGDVTLTNVTGAANITGSGTMGSDELSGLIAHVEGNKTLTFTGCSWTSTITDSGTSTDVYIGGFLGKGTNVGMSVSSGTLGSSTLSGTIRKNNATTAKAGGLVASLSGRTLDIDGLTISNASIEATSATGTCGGLLSYDLLETTTNIAGLTITDSSVNAGSAGFGGLVYKASGVMTI